MSAESEKKQPSRKENRNSQPDDFADGRFAFCSASAGSREIMTIMMDTAAHGAADGPMEIYGPVRRLPESNAAASIADTKINDKADFNFPCRFSRIFSLGPFFCAPPPVQIVMNSHAYRPVSCP